MIKIFTLSFLLLFITTNAVDRSNFKTCSQSSFCKRQREYQSGSDDCNVNIDSLFILKSKLSAEISCKNTESNFILELTKLNGHYFRLKVKEKDPARIRFEASIGDALKAEPEESSMSVSIDKHNKIILIKGSSDEKSILYLSPFKLDFYLNEIPLISVNSRNLFKFEKTILKKAENPPEESATNSSEEVKPEGDVKIEEEDAFKGHKDSRPFGRTSVGLDVSFPGFQFVYGIPEHADKFTLRNTDDTDPYRLYNLDVFEYEIDNPMALYGSVPLMWAHNTNSTAGIFWNNPSETWIDVHSNLESMSTFSKILNFVKSSDVKAKVDTHWMSESGVIDVFFFMGTSPKQVFGYYAKLTGSTPLPPMFALSYHQCRWNYNDQQDVLSVDRQFDEHDIPYDVIWLDIEHTDDKRYFTWDKTKFPNPDEMVGALDVKARKLVTVIDPHIKRVSGWALYDEALTGGYFIKKADGESIYEGWCWPGSSSWPDFMNAGVREWWARQFLTYEASRANNTFSWNDMGEPSVFSGPEVTMEKDAVHLGGWEHREVHNIYGLQIHRATWDGQLLRSNQRERPFVLTRAFFAGSQRFGAVWTGDNVANWDHLRVTTPMLLSLSVAGIHFCGADVGGFFGNPDSELQMRWYQAAAWHPFFRGHAHLDTKRREPYLLGEEHREVVRAAIKERYKMLPYWYTQFHHAEKTGEPVMAPLWQHFPSDEASMAVEDAFMVGPAVLVRPITQQGATSVSVYLPPASEGPWYLQTSWEPLSGGRTHNLAVSPYPVFFRAGHIIPRRERTRRSSLLSRQDPLTLLVFLGPAQTASGNLYLDDQHSLDYQSRPNEASRLLDLSFAEFRLTATDTNPSNTHRTVEEFLRPELERVVVCGLKEKPLAIHYTDEETGKTVQVEFFYMAERLLLVIRNPRVIFGRKWTISLDYHKTEL